MVQQSTSACNQLLTPDIVSVGSTIAVRGQGFMGIALLGRQGIITTCTWAGGETIEVSAELQKAVCIVLYII